MKREIKFRAWQPHHSLHRKPGMYIVRDLYWYEKPDDGKTGEVFFKDNASSEYFEDVHLMQYTGLKDKKGKEIYEGDILDYSIYMDERPSVVEWDEDDITGFFPFNDCDADGQFQCRAKNVLVLGNIYENPELVANQKA